MSSLATFLILAGVAIVSVAVAYFCVRKHMRKYK